LSNNHRIVSIVDDELDITRLFQDAISGKVNGTSVVSFTNPLTALEHFKDNKEAYVVVISDLRIPELNGLELLKNVKKLNPNVRTILTSAYEVDEDNKFQEYAKEGTIDLFLAKPVSIKMLCEEVSNMLHIQDSASH
jgi:DNA-binding NtrC family response regulator